MISGKCVHRSEKITKFAAALFLSLALFIGVAIFSATPVSAATELGNATWRITATADDTIIRVTDFNYRLSVDAGAVTITFNGENDSRWGIRGYDVQNGESLTNLTGDIPVDMGYNLVTGTGGFIPLYGLAFGSEITLSNGAFIEFDDVAPAVGVDNIIPAIGRLQDGSVRFGGGEIRISGNLLSGFTHYGVLNGADVTINGRAQFVIGGSISVDKGGVLRLKDGLTADGNLRGRAAAYVECDGELYISVGPLRITGGGSNFDRTTMIAYDAELRGNGKIYLQNTPPFNYEYSNKCRFTLGSGAALKLSEDAVLDIDENVVVGLMNGYASVPYNTSVNADISGTIHVHKDGELQLTPYSGSINTYGLILRSTGKIIGDAGAKIVIIPSSTSRIKFEEGSLIDMTDATETDKSLFLISAHFDVSEYLEDNSGSLSSYDNAVKSIILWGSIKLNENVLAVIDIPAATFGETSELTGVGIENIVTEDLITLGFYDYVNVPVTDNVGGNRSLFADIAMSDKPMVVRFGSDDTKARELLKSVLTEVTGNGYKTSDIKVGGDLLVLPSEEGETDDMLRYVAELSHFAEDGYGARTTPYYTRPDTPVIDGAVENDGAAINLVPRGTFPRKEFAVLSEDDIADEIAGLSENNVRNIIESYVAEQLKNGNGQDITSLFSDLSLAQFKTYIGGMSKGWIISSLLPAFLEYDVERQLSNAVYNYENSNGYVYINGGRYEWNSLDSDMQTYYINTTLRPSLFNLLKADFISRYGSQSEADLREFMINYSDEVLECALENMGKVGWRGILSQLSAEQIIELTGKSPMQELLDFVDNLDDETMTENQLLLTVFTDGTLPADVFTSYIGNETDIPQWTSNPRFNNLEVNKQYYFISRVPGDAA